MVYRIFVEKKDKSAAKALKSEIKEVLNIDVPEMRELIRYDIEGVSEKEFERAITSVFSEPPVDNVQIDELKDTGGTVFAIGYLDGQYDQRADSAAQCVQLLTGGKKPLVKCARVFVISGASDEEIEKIKKFLINPVESQEVTLEKYQTLERKAMDTAPVSVIEGFTAMSEGDIERFHKENGFAMSVEDLLFVQSYFKDEERDPTETELKVIDTYWSDHCRHTTFLTKIENIEVNSCNPELKRALELYLSLFDKHYKDRKDKYPCLMDIATIGARELKSQGRLCSHDESEEINACSIKVKVNVNGKEEDYLVMFKNETHNHPTEIEPFGGAATCLGGAIRDPLSGRVYVYQSMRITGAADPTDLRVIKGKLPQRVITKTAAKGFSSYGNQIGLATGIVDEVYHEGYRAKRLETGFVIGSNKAENIVRKRPEPGDIVVLLGGETGRDGCGGATGSSKAHDSKSVETCGAEVQKGNALTERKLQRLFKNPEVTKMIKRCNDFGAGGVSVAIGELADGLEINLDQVPKKYEGLSGTELAISESQERMAVVIEEKDLSRFIELAKAENLKATKVATVTKEPRIKMFFKGKAIVDIKREFLNTNGVTQKINAEIIDRKPSFFDKKSLPFKDGVLSTLKNLNVCSKKGLSEMFDSTIGAGTVFMPFGGKTQLTPAISMAAKVDPLGDMASVCAYGFNPYLMSDSPFVGAMYSIIVSLSKLVASGASKDNAYLTLQEYFMKLGKDKKRWGVPLSALLGALYAQLNLKVGAIGGKDSMSGSFENIDVPPTLISFAVAVEKTDKLITNVINKAGEKLYIAKVKKDEFGNPDFESLNKTYEAMSSAIESGKIRFATVVENGGAAVAVIKSCLGNGFGFKFTDDADLFSERPGDIIYSASEKLTETSEYLGETTISKAFTCGAESVTIEEATEAYVSALEKVFPTYAEQKGEVFDASYFGEKIYVSNSLNAKPLVFLPVFPGTNCEFDTMRAFEKAGARCSELIVKNLSPSDIEESVKAIVKGIDGANILMFPGGFSGGDEPDGSGKFIATTFKNAAIKEAVERLLARGGLILGICNGFQALIKLGLVPYGEIRDMTESSPTLTYNRIGRHVSTIVDIKVASTKSPWLSAVNVGEIYKVAVSHGEGRFRADGETVRKLYESGQIATQYVDPMGNPTMLYPYNPNGSACAIEGITSFDGRVFGKMGHSERIGEGLYKNIEGNFDMKIFESGVKYFK